MIRPIRFETICQDDSRFLYSRESQCEFQCEFQCESQCEFQCESQCVSLSAHEEWGFGELIQHARPELIQGLQEEVPLNVSL